MGDVIADRVKVILEAEDLGKATVKAWGDQYDRSTAQVEKATDKAKKAVEDSAAAQARANERAAIAAEKAAAREVRAQEEAARKVASARKRQALTIQQTLNDVIASGSSGNINPLTILAQQGGQVTEAFGGLNNTLKALAPIAFSAGGAITAAGVALGAAVFAADRFDASNKALLTSVTGLGVRAGLTVDELKALAAANAEAGNVSTAASESMAQAYLNTGRIGGDVIGKLIAVTDDYAQVTGQDATKAADELAKIMSDRTGRSALELLDRFGALDSKTQTLIQTLYANGDVQGAQVVVVNRLTDAIAGQADNVGFLTRAWRGLKNAIGSAGTASRDFFSRGTQVEDAFGGFGGGRQTSTQQAASSAAAEAARIAREDRAKAANAIIDDVTGSGRRRELEGKRAQINAALKDGTINAEAAAKALKSLKEDIDQIGAGPKAARAGGGRRASQRPSGPVIRGVADNVVDPSTIVDLTKIKAISAPSIDPTFQAAGQSAGAASEALQRYQDDVYDRTYDSIASGLEAGFRDGLPGVLQFFSQELQRSLISSLAKSLADLISQTGPGGNGGTILTAAAAIFGRANGGNMVGGHPYIVNEGRPEVFVPPVSGKMVPLARTGGGGNVTVVQNFSLGNGNLVTERVYEDMRRVARSEAAQVGVQTYQRAMRDAPGAVAKHQGERG